MRELEERVADVRADLERERAQQARLSCLESLVVARRSIDLDARWPMWLNREACSGSNPFLTAGRHGTTMHTTIIVRSSVVDLLVTHICISSSWCQILTDVLGSLPPDVQEDSQRSVALLERLLQVKDRMVEVLSEGGQVRALLKPRWGVARCWD